VSDRNDGPYAGVHRFAALEFLARWLDHVPERYEVRVRYCGAYATRRRVWWRRRGVTLAGAGGAPPGAAEREETWPALRARRRRWADGARAERRAGRQAFESGRARGAASARWGGCTPAARAGARRARRQARRLRPGPGCGWRGGRLGLGRANSFWSEA